MKILILGAGDMLGHQLCRTVSARFDIWATLRGEPHEIERYGFIPPERLDYHSIQKQVIETYRSILNQITK